jgi:hypothetical protein
VSVLIEALTVIARRVTLDISHPGGVDDFLRIAAERDDVRYAIADEQLVAVSTFEPAAIKFLFDVLSEANLLFSNGDTAAEAVVVDMEVVPDGESPWLMISRHRHGFTTATLTAAPQPRLVTPPSWTLAETWSLFREDLRDDGPENVQSLGVDDGLEHVLDFRTGAVITGTDARSPVHRVTSGGAETPDVPLIRSEEIVGAAFSLLTRLGIPFTVDTEHGCVVLPFGLEGVEEYDVKYTTEDDRLRVMLGASSSTDSVGATVVLPFFLHQIPNGFAAAKSTHSLSLGSDGTQFVTEIDEDTGTMEMSISVQRIDGQSVEDVVERAFVQAARLGTRAVISMRRTIAGPLGQGLRRQ